jgi:hypothetical protein
MCQKWSQSVGWRRPHRSGKYNLKNFSYYTLPYLTLPYSTFFFSSSIAKTAEPICTLDGSNDAVGSKEVPFVGRVERKLHFGVEIPRKPQISEPGCQISSQINTH